jgi:hypothetical protein
MFKISPIDFTRNCTVLYTLTWCVAGSSRVRFPMVSLEFLHNPLGRTMALGSTQPLTEMSTRSNSWGVKAVGA